MCWDRAGGGVHFSFGYELFSLGRFFDNRVGKVQQLRQYKCTAVTILASVYFSLIVCLCFGFLTSKMITSCVFTMNIILIWNLQYLVILDFKSFEMTLIVLKILCPRKFL